MQHARCGWLQSVLLAFPPECRLIDTEDIGGLLQRRRAREHAPNVRLLQLFQRQRITRHGQPFSLTERGSEHMRIDQEIVTENDGAFDRVAQLADIARPRR